MARFDAATGRYVYLATDGVEYRVYFEEGGAGIRLLLQHTAGADGRYPPHLIEDKARSRRRLTKLPNARRQPSPFEDVGWTHVLGRVTRMNPHSYPRLDLR